MDASRILFQTAEAVESYDKVHEIRRRFLVLLFELLVRILSWGFQRTPHLRHQYTTSTPAYLRGQPLFRGFPLSVRLGLTRPACRSCSAFMVSHHLDGFLRYIPRRFVAPCSRTRGSPCSSHPLFACAVPFGNALTAVKANVTTTTPDPSKIDLTAASFLASFRNSLPSCRSPSKEGSTSRFFSAASSGHNTAVSDDMDPFLPWVFPYIRSNFISRK